MKPRTCRTPHTTAPIEAPQRGCLAGESAHPHTAAEWRAASRVAREGRQRAANPNEWSGERRKGRRCAHSE
eukprot:73556-Prymnesium_polylepis.1